MDTPASAGLYTDFNGLAELKSKAKSGVQGTVLEVAKQFEALFLQSMLKSMREAGAHLGNEDQDSQLPYYQEMFDKQIALDIANGQGIGLAAALARQFSGQQESAAAIKPLDKTLPQRPVAAVPMKASNTCELEPESRPAQVHQPRSSSMAARVMAADPVDGHKPSGWQPGDQASFIRTLWPHAQRTAAKLGVQPEVLVAQAALETGWGKKMIRNQDEDSYNLFGIKASASWEGQSASVSTLEYRDGVAAKEIAAFRVYGSVAESMEDYASFIRDNPRYERALAKASDAKGYLHELQRAGYATDPRYADKIGRILDAEPFTKTLAELKSEARTPMI